MIGWLHKCIGKVKMAYPSDKIVIGIASGHAPGSVSFMETELNIQSLNEKIIPDLLQRPTEFN